MKRNIFLAILLLATIAFSCTPKEEFVPSDKVLTGDGSIVYNPTATIESFILDGPATKTVLAIDDVTGATFTFAEGDKLGVFPYSPEIGNQVSFDVKNASETSCTFNGRGFGLKEGQLYAAYYPYDKNYSPDDPNEEALLNAIQSIPVDYTKQRQETDGAFNISAADYLVANGISPANGACNFNMSHVGALLVMDVTLQGEGYAKYTELSLNIPVASFVQTGTIDLTAPNTVISDPDKGKSITLALGEGTKGLSLTAGQTHRFCMMVAPVDLKTGSVPVTLTLKDKAGNPHSTTLTGKNFRAGYAYKYACTVEAAPDETPASATNLGKNGTANTYIVDVDDVNPLGYYFTTTVAGNGVSMQADILGYFGATGANLWPQNGNPALIGASTVSVLWNENNCISDVAYNASDRTISFKATGAKGNAKVCAQINGINFWTWLIWCTDQPGTIEFTNELNGYTFTVMDRNIGAITNLGSTDNHAMSGVYYQWGNPIPYKLSEWAASSYANSNNNMMNSLWYPETVHVPVKWVVQWFAPDGNYPNQLYGLLWGGGCLGAEQAGLDAKYHIRHGNTSEKTMYDPCPPGYKVLPYDFLDGYGKVGARTNASANVYGIVLAGDNGGEVLLPYNGMAWVGGNGLMSWAQGGVYDPVLDNAVYMYLWTSAYNNTNVPYNLCASANNATEININDNHILTTDASGHGMGVRCVAEQ
ncbi:MAG: hypothetical protein IJR87_11780 [Bacteroidaceae bacterium]|nr:hypothetical protein [Bacteroidaceae bacterium]